MPGASSSHSSRITELDTPALVAASPAARVKAEGGGEGGGAGVRAGVAVQKRRGTRARPRKERFGDEVRDAAAALHTHANHAAARRQQSCRVELRVR